MLIEISDIFFSYEGFFNDLAEKIASKYNWTYQFKLSGSQNSAIGKEENYRYKLKNENKN